MLVVRKVRPAETPETMKDKAKTIKEAILITLACIAIAGASYLYFSHKQTNFNPVDLISRTDGKNIEDYFVEKLGMTYEEAKPLADLGVSFYITENTTLDGIVGNLHYYGLVKDEKAFREALEKTKDTTPGKEGAIKVGNNTIDINAYYGLKKGLTAWEVADIMVNQPTYLKGTKYNYIFMPGGLKSEMPTGGRPTE